MTTPPMLDDPAQIRAIAKRFADQTTPLTRQRVNVLSAAASVVTQLPADELATFVRSSAHLSTRLLELTATLDTAGRALLDYAEALERRQTISEEPDYLDETMPRSLDTGSSLVHPRALPTHSISEHLVGAKADEGTVTGRSATEAVEHELDFLRTRCLEVLREQADRWVHTQRDGDPYELARSLVSRPGGRRIRLAGQIEVFDSVVPVEIDAPKVPRIGR